MNRLVAVLLLLAALLIGCSPAATDGAKAGLSDPAPSGTAPATPMLNIAVPDLLKRIEAGEKPLIIDVREQSEWDQGHIEGAQLMPLGEIEQLIEAAKIPKDQEVVLICRSGNRSAQAYRKLEALGYTNLKNTTGGMNEWAKIGPVVK